MSGGEDEEEEECYCERSEHLKIEKEEIEPRRKGVESTVVEGIELSLDCGAVLSVESYWQRPNTRIC